MSGRPVHPDALSPTARAVYDVVAAAGADGAHVSQIRERVEASPTTLRQTLSRLAKGSGLIRRAGHGVYALARASAAPPEERERPTFEFAAEPAVVPFRVPVVRIDVGEGSAYVVYVEAVGGPGR